MVKKTMKTYDSRLAVVSRGSYHPPRVRHIGTSTKNTKPICSEYGYRWSASTSKQIHSLPLCKRCAKIVEGLHASLMKDPGRVDINEELEKSRAEFMALLADFDQ